MNGEPELIEAYLDELLGGLRGRPRDVRRMLAETEDHLQAAISDGQAHGLTETEATRAALERFGPAADVIRAWNATPPLESLPMFLARLVNQMLPLLAVGLIAIGLSGVTARVMTAIWGPTFMYADPPGTTYPASACQHWMSLHPTATNCTSAYLAEAQSDGQLARYGAGLVGLVLLVVVALLRRRRHAAPIVSRPPTLLAFGATSVYVVASFGLLALAVDAIRISGGHGAGQWISAAVIALPLGCAYGYRFLNSGRDSAALL